MTTQQQSRPKILYIDDTVSARVLVRRLLSRDYVFNEAPDGLQGIELARQIKPDLVLVDLHMPHLNGYEVATRIKSLMSEVPVVALTADVTAYVRERVLASGCDGYLSKPIDPDTFVDQIQVYLGGEREQLQDERFRQEYQQKLVARMEEKVRELTEALDENAKLNAQNVQLWHNAERRAKLLEVAARVSRSTTSILDLDPLLEAIVETIVQELAVYYVGVFLLDEMGEWAVLRAASGQAGSQMLENRHQRQVGGHSMIGAATQSGQPGIASDVSQDSHHAPNPLLPDTRSEIVLPLKIGDQLIGALDVQSDHVSPFTKEDLTALESMADQLAIAINNARLLNRLKDAHQELVRTKTYQAIATATGEAIHWVGNKAAPIPASVNRIREDVSLYLYAAHLLIDQVPAEFQEHKYAQLVQNVVQTLVNDGLDVRDAQEMFESRSLKQLQRILDIESVLEDLDIIHASAQAILNIKEDLIGPARQQRIAGVCVPELVQETVASMGIPERSLSVLSVGQNMWVQADHVQLGRVFTNLIKNAVEAMAGIPEPKLLLWSRLSDDGAFVVTDVTDNGEGIAPDQLDKIWMAFYTTKGDRGGTGLGLPACAQIIGELGGKITVESDLGLGTTFSVSIPVYRSQDGSVPEDMSCDESS